VNYDCRDRPEQRGADYHRRQPELQRQNAEGQQVERDRLDLKVRVNDVGDPQDDDCADDEFRVLCKCGHRGRSSWDCDEQKLGG
jgi:hypothetical protein